MIKVEPHQWTFEANPDEPILDAARRAGIRLPKSCRNGTCRTCMCRMVSGSVRYRIEWPGLTREEKEEGHILPCVAVALDDVVISVPSAQRVDASGAIAATPSPQTQTQTQTQTPTAMPPPRPTAEGGPVGEHT